MGKELGGKQNQNISYIRGGYGSRTINTMIKRQT